MEDLGGDKGLKIRNGAIDKILNGTLSSFLSLALLGLILYFTDASRLPDFDSYYVMYEGGNFDGGYLGFSVIALILQSLGVDYRQFRLLLLAIGLIFVFIIFKLRRVSYLNYQKNSRRFSSKNIKLTILISIFIFEFYVIRLRAGISIFFFALFIYVWQSEGRHKQVQPIKFILLLGFFLLSALIHFDTFIGVTLFVGPAFISSQYVKHHGKLDEFLYFTICLGLWLALFWFGITFSLERRGPELFSELNPVRFLMISILPIVAWLYTSFFYSSAKRNKLEKLSFPYFFALNYVSSAIALLTYYYFSPEAKDAGEAIVRVMTLSSFGAILSLALGGLSYRNMLALYILIVNSLFFLNTIFG